MFTETVNYLTTVSGERPDISRQINEALKNPSSRIDAVNDFFHRTSGEGPNYGLDVVGFMEWERDSGRLGKEDKPGSTYWKLANGAMIHDMLMAEELIKQGKENLATEEEKYWIEFIKDPSQAKLWDAHNQSINIASKKLYEGGIIDLESSSERAFIASVLLRVNATSVINFPADKEHLYFLGN